MTEKSEKMSFKGQLGGYRPNSGRKPSIELLKNSVRKEISAEFWLELAETYADPFIRRVFDDPTVAWEVRFRLWQEVMNRAYGKPKESHDVTSKGEKLGGAVINIIAPNGNNV